MNAGRETPADPPPWHALLGPLPAGSAPRLSPVGPPALHGTPEGAVVAGWETLVLELSAGSAGLRVLQVLRDAEGRLLSASDHVLFRSEAESALALPGRRRIVDRRNVTWRRGPNPAWSPTK